MLPDDDGGWSFDWDRTAGSTGSGSTGTSNGTLVASADSSSGSGQWTGWLQSLVTTGVSYALAKDAAESGMVQSRASNGQIVYVPAGSTTAAGGLSNGALLLIAAAIVGAVLIAKG